VPGEAPRSGGRGPGAAGAAVTVGCVATLGHGRKAIPTGVSVGIFKPLSFHLVPNLAKRCRQNYRTEAGAWRPAGTGTCRWRRDMSGARRRGWGRRKLARWVGAKLCSPGSGSSGPKAPPPPAAGEPRAGASRLRRPAGWEEPGVEPGQGTWGRASLRPRSVCVEGSVFTHTTMTEREV